MFKTQRASQKWPPWGEIPTHSSKAEKVAAPSFLKASEARRTIDNANAVFKLVSELQAEG